ncbi:MoxR family ATPase [Pleionea sp. CnH1-48]|uniref:AAA family ATPase n=1 Tax=Pleionea sp. CnH1-48 TaxID=2954494 RepID=UPI002097AC48|nr:MoxR family ATPase [Pleionea sp. CnH1-48]MCO7222974.1 MoxR family ATPase [Pleionea sp. CnH1-48]
MDVRSSIQNLRSFLEQRIIGQHELIEKILIALLADGHLLVEGAPGLAKTRAIKELAQGVEGDFHRIQFTPDLLPADLTGTDIFRPQTGTFEFQQGPIFHNLILADEINRAPAKVQSALLEAMAERQITVGGHSYPLAPLFMVMATQNPIEQEGTYPLPEAQLDRFLMHVLVDYPDAAAESEILRLTRQEAHQKTTESKPASELTQEALFKARDEILDLHMVEEVEQYIVQLVMATRDPKPYDKQLARWIDYGASPRATISLDRCARAHAWLQGKDFVTPENVQQVAYDVLRHRILLTYEAEAEGISPDEVIKKLLEIVPVV